MDQEIKARWIELLRSGEYEQTRGKLGIDESNLRCCLGVLCDIGVDKGLLNVEPYSYGPGLAVQRVYIPVNNTEDDFAVSVLPVGFSNYLGLQDEAGTFIVPGGILEDGYPSDRKHLNLALLNDEGFTFDQIADIIDYFF